MRVSLVSAALFGAALAQQPCAQAASQVAQYNGEVDADVALACLKSVPVDKSGDLQQIEGLLSFVNFQSTLGYLKDPTPGYPFAAVDVISELQTIQSNVQNDKYDSEYDVQNDILLLWNLVHDGHFVYTPDITQVFLWQRSANLYSVSTDGTSVPKPYVSWDVEVLAGVSNADYTPSPVTEINGVAAETFLEQLANATSYNNHDPDACYNQLFPITSLSGLTSSPYILFSQQYQYQGSTTQVTFANGTRGTVQTYASTQMDFSGVTSGATFFDKFCSNRFKETATWSAAASTSAAASSTAGSASGSNTASSSAGPTSSAAKLHRRASASSSSASSGSTAAPASGSQAATSIPPQADLTTQVPYSAVPSQTVLPKVETFPSAWLLSGDRTIGCYFPADNSDLTVVSIPSFEPTNVIEFEDVMRRCLATSGKQGKTKLIIDLRGNGGGDVDMAYDLFKQLFPSLVPWGSSNFRAWDLFKDMTQAISQNYANTPFGKYGYNGDYGSIFNVAQDLNTTLQDFSSWEDFYGPVNNHGDTFTNLVRYNLSNTYAVSDPIDDYGSLANSVTKQTFQSSDILLIQDGQCASTCTVFSEFMKEQGNVSTIAFGGRAQTGPMQGIGGTKGANDYALIYLLGLAQQAFRGSSTYKQWASSFAGVEQALARSTGQTGNINFRNNIREGDETETPLQFVYEAADCRLFYTAEQIFNQELVWKAAYASFWSGASCVSGSTNQLSSKPGDGYILASPGATKDPSTPTSAIVSPTGAAAPMRTAAALAAMVPAFAAGAMLL